MFDIYDSIFNALNTQVLQPCEFQAGFSASTGSDQTLLRLLASKMA